jgi:malate/lactate dehydrogenase
MQHSFLTSQVYETSSWIITWLHEKFFISFLGAEPKNTKENINPTVIGQHGKKKRGGR